MTIRKKIHVLICVLSVLCIVIGLCFIFVSIENATIPFRTTEERADIKIAQYKERPYANNDIRIEEPVPFTFSRLSINKEKSLTNGCSLRFSFVPQEKVIEPDGVVNYSITLSNKGKETCTNVSFSVYYRDTERYITSDKAPTASDYYWAVGDLESSERYTVLLKTQSDVQNGREIDSEACATGDNSQDVCSNNVIFINAGTSLSTTGTTVMPKRSIKCNLK